jgi:hypothetical protein
LAIETWSKDNAPMIHGSLSLSVFFVCVVTGTAAALAMKSKSLGEGAVMWLGITGVVGWLGLVRDFNRLPPPMFVLLLIAVTLTTLTAWSRIGSRLIGEAGIAWLVGMQAFRIAVEIFLDWGHRAGLLPVQMTFEGRNWDIVSGVSAAGVGWLAAKGKAPRWLILAWNCVGLALLVNIVVLAILSMPSPFQRFHNQPANSFIAYFPYIWLPTFLVQVALFGHLLVFRWLREKRT